MSKTRRLALLLSLLPGVPLFGDPYLLKNVKVADPATREVWSGHLLVDHGKVHRLSKLPATVKGTTLDLSGKWIVPGLTDMHDHSTLGNPGPGGVIERLSIEDVARRMLYSGVTAFVDLMANEDEIFLARRRQRQEKQWKGARLYAAGPMLTSSGGHGTEFGEGASRVMDDPAQAKKQIAQLVKKKPDFLKIAYDHARDYKSMDRKTMEAVVAEAKRHGIKTIVHIGTWQDAREATEAGATVITHLHESPMPDDLPKLMARKGTWEIPTLTYQCDLLEILENRALLGAPLLQQVTTPELLAAYRSLDPSEGYVARALKDQAKGRDAYRAAIQKLHAAGVKLMTGTDSGDLGVFQGYSVHREMALLVKDGLSPWEALAAGTTLPKQFLGRPSGIAEGQSADFVVLAKSPLDDITNTQTVEMVFQDGKLVDRAALLPSPVPAFPPAPAPAPAPPAGH